MTVEFTPYPKTPRLFRDIIVTEKIDGTNAAIQITEVGGVSPVGTLVNVPGGVGSIVAQSRKRLITPKDDNFGFARWVHENADVLAATLGPGIHFGEWWGSGIQRGYGLPKGEKRFSLFNVKRWDVELRGNMPAYDAGLRCVPVLYEGSFSTPMIEEIITDVRTGVSPAARREGVTFPNPEGIIVYHTAAGQAFKVLCENDDISKTEAGI